jgi:hypothetical protein
MDGLTPPFGQTAPRGARFSRIPSRLAHHARPIRQYRTDATLSRLLPPSPATPGSGCLQLHPAAATARRWTVSHLHPKQQRLVAHANRRHMIGDHHGRTAGRAILLVRAMDEILGTHRCAVRWVERTGRALTALATASRSAKKDAERLRGARPRTHRHAANGLRTGARDLWWPSCFRARGRPPPGRAAV